MSERSHHGATSRFLVQLGASYAHVARILNCTTLTITRLIQRYRVTSRTADRPRSGRPRATTANEDRHLHILQLRNRFLHCDVICSDWTLICLQSSHCTSSTTTSWHQQGLSTIQRDDIYEATSTSTVTLGTSVSTLATSELATCTLTW